MGHWGISQNPGKLPQNPRFLQDGAANAPGEKFRVLEGDWVSLPGCWKSHWILSGLDFPSGKWGRIRSLAIPHRSASDPHQEFPTFIHAGISVRLEPRKVSHRPHFPPTEILFFFFGRVWNNSAGNWIHLSSPSCPYSRKICLFF